MVTISVDAGNGGTNATDGKTEIYFPSVRAAATGDTLGLGSQFELEYEWVDWNGHRYVIGDDVLNISRRGIERHQGAFRYGDEFHQFLVACAVSKMGICSGSVKLVLFAPPGMYNDAKETMQERFLEKNGNVALKFKSDQKPRKFKYTSVDVFPEGIGAVACFLINKAGKALNHELFVGTTVVLDGGMHTLDALEMVNGNFNPESLSTATWENGGLKSHVLEPVLRRVKKMGEDFDLLTIDDIDAVLRNGIQSDNWLLRTGGESVNLEALFDKHAERYAQWISNNIIDGVFNGLRAIKNIILVGGAAVLIDKHLSKWYGEKVLMFNDHKSTKNISPVFANAVGGIRLSKMLAKKK